MRTSSWSSTTRRWTKESLGTPRRGRRHASHGAEQPEKSRIQRSCQRRAGRSANTRHGHPPSRPTRRCLSRRRRLCWPSWTVRQGRAIVALASLEFTGTFNDRRGCSRRPSTRTPRSTVPDAVAGRTGQLPPVGAFIIRTRTARGHATAHTAQGAVGHFDGLRSLLCNGAHCLRGARWIRRAILPLLRGRRPVSPGSDGGYSASLRACRGRAAHWRGEHRDDYHFSPLIRGRCANTWPSGTAQAGVSSLAILWVRALGKTIAPSWAGRAWRAWRAAAMDEDPRR